MNPQFHQEFVALCALFFTGELTDEEWALLQVHLAYCDTCRTTFEEYKQLHRNVIPAMAAAGSDVAEIVKESDRDFEEAEKRLLEAIEGPGHLHRSPPLPHRSRTIAFSLIAAGAAAAAVFGYFRMGHTGIKQPVVIQAVASPSVPPVLRHPASSDQALQHDLDESQREVQILRERLAAAEAGAPRSIVSEKNNLQQRDGETTNQQLLPETNSLPQRLASAQTDLQQMRDNLAVAKENASQLTVRTSSLEARVRQLSDALEEKNAALEDRERMLELDRDFLSHDRDIRDLMGARNLYIADIYDTNENGKTAKPFGRIFYTKERSLVFYGFDLEKQPGLKRNVAFQAWGSGTDAKPVSLGLFYLDDSHTRWVVRFSDPKTLSRLNTVFVTVEPPGGSNRPTGKQLLRAYLQIEPNHP